MPASNLVPATRQGRAYCASTGRQRVGEERHAYRDAAQRLAVTIHKHRESCTQESIDRSGCRGAAVQ
jgi:hypothetical protein